MVCDKVVCERWCVTKWWCMTKLHVKDGVTKMVCERFEAAGEEAEEVGYRIKNKNPTPRCGEKG